MSVSQKTMQTRSIVIFSKPYEILSTKYLWPSTGSIKPIYKNKGNPLDPKNFRPITILRVFSEEVFLLEENQFGFRKLYSTTDSIFTLFSFFEILKSKKKKLCCAYVDFEKAFDTVWRVALWYKLLLIINGKM